MQNENWFVPVKLLSSESFYSPDDDICQSYMPENIKNDILLYNNFDEKMMGTHGNTRVWKI